MPGRRPIAAYLAASEICGDDVIGEYSNYPLMRTRFSGLRLGLIADHFKIEACHGRHFSRAGEQLHLADPEIFQDLSTNTVGAQVHARTARLPIQIGSI